MIAGYSSAREIRPETLFLPPAGVDQILRAVGDAFGLTVADLKAHSRRAGVVRARNAAAFLLRARPSLGGRQRSYPEIGALLGGRDHSTLVHAVTMAIRTAQRDPGYAAAVTQLAERADLSAVPDVGALVLPERAAGAGAGHPLAEHPLAGLAQAPSGDVSAEAIRARRETRDRVERELARRTPLRETSTLEDDDIDARRRAVASARLLDAILAARAVAT